MPEGLLLIKVIIFFTANLQKNHAVKRIIGCKFHGGTFL